uniref:Huntingtin n=1 Tax=Angiostrongylus cantonensis TaxID=6313 RepID=A0A0K0D197_ANGCA
MALLSDLFDDSGSYEFLYFQMRNLFQGGYLKHHSDIGYVIYSLLKSVTVIGLETAARGITENDLCKQILTWVEYGLTASSPFVREATLHGFIYLMQSITLDPLKPVVQYVTTYRRCDSRDAELISFVLPSVLLRLYAEERVLAIVLDFCSPANSGGYPGHICYSLKMMFELCERMRDSQRLSSLMTFAQQVVLRIQQRPPLSREDRAVASCLLAAVSSYECIAYRFPAYLAALTSSESFESSYEFLLHKASEECSSSC